MTAQTRWEKQRNRRLKRALRKLCLEQERVQAAEVKREEAMTAATLAGANMVEGRPLEIGPALDLYREISKAKQR
jgi:coenzyme F420-reducing hydrogenase delta subunit